MHRHGVMCNNAFTHYPSVPHRHHGINVCSSCEISEPISASNVNCYGSSCYYDHSCRRGIPCIDYPCHDYVSRTVVQPPPPPPITLTNVRNDIRYVVDDPDDTVYEDDYGRAYKLCRSKVQLVDVLPQNNRRTTSNRLIVSKHGSCESPERILVPRSTALRQRSLPSYERRKPFRLVPLYHSAAPQYVITERGPSVKKLVPLATVYNPQKRTIKVRSLSP